jgi:hypothetical protein
MRSWTTLTQQAFALLLVAPTEVQYADSAVGVESWKQVRHIPLALCSAAVCATQGSQTVAHAHLHSGQLDAPPKGAQGVTTDHPVPVTARLAQLLPLSATQYVWPLHITCPPKVLGPTPGVVLHRLYCMVGTDTFKATAATGSAEQTSASAVARRFRLGDDIVVARGRSVGCVHTVAGDFTPYCCDRHWFPPPKVPRPRTQQLVGGSLQLHQCLAHLGAVRSCACSGVSEASLQSSS